MQSELEFVCERFAIVKKQKDRIDKMMIETAHLVDDLREWPFHPTTRI